MKIISFSQQGPRAICIISAVGLISNVTLRQPNTSGGTLTYEVGHLSAQQSIALCFASHHGGYYFSLSMAHPFFEPCQ